MARGEGSRKKTQAAMEWQSPRELALKHNGDYEALNFYNLMLPKGLGEKGRGHPSY